MSGFQLRDYQREALDNVRTQLLAGKRKQLVVMGTGGGKTATMSHIRDHLGLRKKMLWVAHRKELLDQAAGSMLKMDPTLRVEIEQADRHASPSADIVVASRDTLGRSGSKRLQKFNPADYDCVVVDECHHLDEDNTTYNRVLDHFGVGMHQVTRDKLLLGLTATPQRTSGKGLGDYFEVISFKRDMRQLIRDDWLCPIRAYTIRSDTDLDGVTIRAGDFAVGELSEAVSTAERNELTVKAYQDKGDGRKALPFCVDVEHAEKLRDAFVEAGYDARSIFGHTTDEEREENLHWFHDTPGAIMTNVGVFSEGTDVPSIECVIMCRPTKSSLFFTQAVGRGTRLSPETGKTDCLVLDICDSCSKTKLMTTADLWALPAEMDAEGRNMEDVADEFKALQDENPTLDLGDCLTMDEVRQRLKHADLFEQADNEATEASEYSWSRVQDQFALHLPPPRDGNDLPFGRIAVERNLLGEWEVSFFPKRNWRAYEKQRQLPITSALDLEQAILAADEYVNQHRADARTLMKKDAGWRRKQASEKQLGWMRKIAKRDDGMAAFLTKYAEPTRGQASAALDAYQARRRTDR